MCGRCWNYQKLCQPDPGMEVWEVSMWVGWCRCGELPACSPILAGPTSSSTAVEIGLEMDWCGNIKCGPHIFGVILQAANQSTTEMKDKSKVLINETDILNTEVWGGREEGLGGGG